VAATTSRRSTISLIAGFVTFHLTANAGDGDRAPLQDEQEADVKERAPMIGRERSVVQQVRDAVRQIIWTEKLGLGDRLPTEERLAERFGVSRPALREALRSLEQDGIIRTEHGRGRFVMAGAALKVERPITTFESVTEMLGGFGYKTTTRLLSMKQMPANEELAVGLHCSRGSPVVQIERLRSKAGRPILYSLDYVPAEIAGKPAMEIDWEASIVRTLRRCGVGPVASTARVSATALPEKAKAAWKLPDFGVALLITETCFTLDGLPILFARDFHHGKYFSFSFTRR
jgi:GntR family transcriptional regulator